MSQAIVSLMLLSVLLGLPAAQAQMPEAADDEAVELAPLVVEGERGELDSVGGVYRKRLPCIGDCDAAPPEPTAMQRLYRGIGSLFLPPQPQPPLAVHQPTEARLDDKLP